ncbi:MAG TPA: FG-GAP-like repeat-containing protein [Thermoanaerobaculia bacterium]|nr:FG-GAP-like repeat-containing protein [Thermoanaerobaculia bacterium]
MPRPLVSLLLLLLCSESLFARTVLVREVLRPKDMHLSVLVTVADFDGDGDTDWLRFTGSALLVYRANGDGTFAAPVSTSTSGLSLQTFLTAGDVNGDGRADLLYKNGANSGRVLLSGVAGGLTAGATLTAAASTFTVARMADVTGDGHADVVVSGLCVFAGNGAGGFAAPVTTTDSSSTFELGDANGDESADVFSLVGNQLGLRLAQSGGTWSARTTIGTTAFIALADFDGGGDLDVATDSRILLGNGDGTFTDGATHTFPAAMQRLVAADLDGDGRADLLAEYSERVMTMLNNGGATFGAVRGYEATGALVSDFDGDGHVDLTGTTILGPGVSTEGIALGNGDGTFRANASYPFTDASCGARPVAAADVTGDGKLDIITMRSAVIGPPWNFLTVLPSLGDGTFGAPIDTPATYEGYRMVPRDLNGDTQMDLIVDNGGKLCVFLGAGAGTFTATPCTDTSGASRMFVDDFDDDGHDDVLIPSPDGPRIYPGNGAGGFGAAIQPDLPGYGSVADFNADGDPDYLSDDVGTATIHYGAAGAAFTSPGVVIQRGQQTVEHFDMNGDGASDLLLWKYPTLTILPGVPGSMTIGPARQIAAEDGPGVQPAAADLDGDGARDMVSYSMMFRGDGNGGFAETTKLRGPYPYGFALADLDGNGTDDVVTVNCQTVTVRLTGKDAWADLAMTFDTFSGETTYTGSPLAVVYGAVSETGYTPGGSFTVRENGVLLGYELANEFSGPAVVLEAGTHLLDVEYSGDAYFAPVTTTTTITIAKGTIALSASAPSTVASGATVTVSASLAREYSQAAPPAGTITLREGATVYGTKPAAESVSFTIGPLAAGAHTLTVEYSGDTNYLTTSDTVDVTVAPPDAAIVTATALSTTSIAVSWTPVTGAVSYDVYRRVGDGAYALATTVTALNWTDTGRAATTTHLYQVLARNGANETISLSAPDFATTVMFSDAALPGVKVKLVHVTQLRSAINAVRTAAGLSAFSFAPTPALGSIVLGLQLAQMRTALVEGRTALGFATSFTEGSVIAAVHLEELRDQVQ